MKTILLVCAILGATLLSAQETSKKDPRLCKIFQDKIVAYEKQMRDDGYAQTTLQSYKDRAKIYCGK
jgi:hypothetical protein